jgi:oligoribonuclease
MSYLVPIDVETTGLRPEEGHLLLEISVFVAASRPPFAVLDDGYHAVIRHERQIAWARADSYVMEMHAKTGLWDRLESEGKPLEQVDEEIVAYLSQFMERREGLIFGNSVRLDHNFIDAYLPRTADFLHYRQVDMTSIAFWAEQAFDVPRFEKKYSHIAEEDIRESLGELRYVTHQLKLRASRPEDPRWHDAGL